MMGTLHGLSSRENGTEPISLSIRPNQKKMLQTDVFIGQANTNENNTNLYQKVVFSWSSEAMEI